MRALLQTLIILITISFVSICMAKGTTTTSPENEHDWPAVTFQIIHNQLNLDDDTIESATIDYPNGTTYAHSYGVRLKLSPSATEQLQKLTQANIGHKINIILNGNLISSPTIQGSIGSQMLITSLTEEQAIQFIQSLEMK